MNQSSNCRLRRSEAMQPAFTIGRKLLPFASHGALKCNMASSTAFSLRALPDGVAASMGLASLGAFDARRSLRPKKLEKRSCVRVVPLPGKGLGVVASKRLQCGEVVAEEVPLLQIGPSWPPPEEQMEKLSASQVDQIWDLSDCSGGESLEGILNTNCFRANSDERVLCPSLARFNHSCAPNCDSAA
ncbi:unnamed protein product [Durusdinium trenchii]|uniref:SET domain-containing protein n=1 Tax=Durusdinium trenchii TaxID=1381693 RepID=A0ABP0IHM3_9DINO